MSSTATGSEDLQGESGGNHGTDGTHVVYFCAFDFYTLSDGDGVTGQSCDPPSSSPMPVAVVRAVVYADSGKIASSVGFDYEKPLRVLNDCSNASQDQNTSSILLHFLLPLNGMDTSITPVAVFTRCEKTLGCRAYESVAADTPHITHGTTCVAARGGEFYTRDRLTGFPHRSA